MTFSSDDRTPPDGSEILNTMRQAVENMKAYRREHGVAIAISFSPAGFNAVSSSSAFRGRSPEGRHFFVMPSGIRTYIWHRQTEPYKVYYDEQEFLRWFEEWANEGDLAPFQVDGVTPIKRWASPGDSVG